MIISIDLNEQEFKGIDDALTCLSNRFYWLSLESLDPAVKADYKDKELQLCKIRQKLTEANIKGQLENAD